MDSSQLLKEGKFVSIHIPKTGGTIFVRRVLRELFPERVMVDFNSGPGIDRRLDDPKGHAHERDIVHGHFPPSKYEHLNRPFIVWIREPVARLVSHFDYWRKRKNWGPPEDRTLGIVEFAEHHRNLMSRYLEDRPLEDFAFIGVLDFYMDSMRRLEKLLGKFLSPYMSAAYLNEILGAYSRNEKTRITADQEEALQEMNREDIRLYLTTLERFYPRAVEWVKKYHFLGIKFL